MRNWKYWLVVFSVAALIVPVGKLVVFLLLPVFHFAGYMLAAGLAFANGMFSALFTVKGLLVLILLTLWSRLPAPRQV